MLSDTHVLSLGLSPEEVVAVIYLRTRVIGDEIHARTVDLAAVLGCSYRKAAKVVASLIERGVIDRVVRGIYRVGHVLRARAEEVHAGAVRVVSSKATEQQDLLPVGASHLQSGGFHPPRRDEETSMARDDYETEGDDLAGPGLIDDRPPAKSRHRAKSRYKVPDNHRETPREDWTMDFVTKEFRLRLQKAKPLTLDNWRTAGVIGVGTGGNRMLLALKKWEFEYGITPQEAALLVDRFFDDPKQVARLDNTVPAYRIFMEYLKRNIDHLRQSTASPERSAIIAQQVIHL